jgi:hypothetical protein
MQHLDTVESMLGNAPNHLEHHQSARRDVAAAIGELRTALSIR